MSNQYAIDADVLVAENTTRNQSPISELLKAAGMRVRVAGNGIEALREIERNRPDLLLVDCQMPVLDGFESIRRLRVEDGYADLPMIAITASDDHQTRYLETDARLTRPIDPAMLFSLLDKHLAPAHATRSVTPPSATLKPPTPVSPERSADKQHDTPEDGTENSGLLCLPGVDEATGLVYVRDDLALFVRLLCKFESQQGMQFETDFNAALAAQDWRESTRIAHSLKSVARTLGMRKLAEHAAQLERAALTQSQEQIESLLPDLLVELERIRQGIRGLDG